MSTDYEISDPEVLDFPAVVDGLADSGTAEIGPDNVRAIWKSAVPRYFQLAVSEYTSGATPLWSGQNELPTNLPDQAANKKVVGNGFVIGTNGVIVYNGVYPMLCRLTLSASFSQTIGGAHIRLAGTHVNDLNNIREPLFAVYTALNTPVVKTESASVSAMFTITNGSKVSITRQFTTGNAGTDFTIDDWQFGLVADPLVPAITEIRGGTYGSVNAQASLFSIVPFEVLYVVPDVSVWVPGTPGGLYGIATVNGQPNHLVVSLATAEWGVVGPLIVQGGTTPANTANALGNEGDFYMLGHLTDPVVQIYGPKANGYWPIYPREVHLSALGG